MVVPRMSLSLVARMERSAIRDSRIPLRSMRATIPAPSLTLPRRRGRESGLLRGLGVDDEIIGRRGPPQRERVLGPVALRLPLLGPGNVIDVAGIFGEAAPRVLHVVEIVRAEHVAAEAPSFDIAL